MSDLQVRIEQILDGFRQEHIHFEEAVNLLESYLQMLPPPQHKEFFKTLWIQYLNEPISHTNGQRSAHSIIVRGWSAFGPADDLSRIIFSRGWKDEAQTESWVVVVGSELLHSLWTYRSRFSKTALGGIKLECAPFLSVQYEQLFGFRLSARLVEFFQRLDKVVDRINFERNTADIRPRPEALAQGPAEDGPAHTREPAETDDLLPIFRRSQFERDFERLTGVATQSAPLGLLVIDFDLFKAVNDAFGHPVGDEVLVGTASTIKVVCEGKGRCYRWGGDELTVLLPNHTSREAMAVAERIQEAIAEVRFANYPHEATLSIGVASYPGSCSSIDQFFKAADDAALAAKQAGRDRVVVAGASVEKVSSPAAVRLSATDISTRLERVRLWVRGLKGRASNVNFDLVNKSNEEVALTEVRLESNGYAITEPAFPSSVEVWKVCPNGEWPISFSCKPDPAAALIRMNDNEGLFFKTDLRVVLIYSVLGQSREFSQMIPVQVKVTSSEVVSLV